MKKALIRLLTGYSLFTILYFIQAKIEFVLNSGKKGIIYFFYEIIFWGERVAFYFITVISVSAAGFLYTWVTDNKDYSKIFGYFFVVYVLTLSLLTLMP